LQHDVRTEPLATLLLTEQPDGSYITSRYSPVRLRVLVRLRAHELDRVLASGASPDSSAALSVRARQLIGWTARRRLSQEIRSLLVRAERPIHPIHSTVAVCRCKIVDAREALLELAEQLISPGPVDARGVAQLRRLLRDGDGPVFRHPREHDLESELDAVNDALVVCCEAAQS
jgi:hypothetical protein